SHSRQIGNVAFPPTAADLRTIKDGQQSTQSRRRTMPTSWPRGVVARGFAWYATVQPFDRATDGEKLDDAFVVKRSSNETAGLPRLWALPRQHRPACSGTRCRRSAPGRDSVA